MNKIVLFLFLIISITGLSAHIAESIPDYYVEYVADSNINSNEGKVTIVCTFGSEYNEQPHTLTYGINGSTQKVSLAPENTFSFNQQPGNYTFQFYYNSSFIEIETDSLAVLSGKRTIIHVHFHQAIEMQLMKKPVIYLYPEKPTEVALSLKTMGKLTFTYPELNGSWYLTAHPDGTLNIGKQTYPYLFWEAEQIVESPFYASTHGFVVSGSNVLSFLDDKLTGMGFNDRERTDFITFWGPQLAVNAYNLIQFQFNETCDRYATLNISPTPAHINRVYMVWTSSQTAENDLVQLQVLPVLDRSGFDVLEWGGVEVVPITVY